MLLLAKVFVGCLDIPALISGGPVTEPEREGGGGGIDGEDVPACRPWAPLSPPLCLCVVELEDEDDGL